MIDVGVVGCGISALMVTLSLRDRGVPVTLYADRSAVGYGRRLPNTVARYGRSMEIEHRLGVDHWRRREVGIKRVDVAVAGTNVHFSGALPGGGSCVDFRTLLRRLLADCVSRGTRLEPAAAAEHALQARRPRHDLVVVSSGASESDVFALDVSRCDGRPARRTLFAAVCDAGDHSGRPLLTIDVTPGIGEVFTFPCLSRQRRRTAVLVEAVPDSPLDDLVQRSDVASVEGASELLAAVVHGFVPRLRTGAGSAMPVLTDGNDVLRGAVRPAVRQFWTVLPSNTYAVALGDAWILNDPIAGVGANLAIQCADRLAALVASAEHVDETFCIQAECAIWKIAELACWWTDAQLDAPPALATVIGAAAHDQAVADGYIANMTDLAAMRRALADETAAQEFIAATKHCTSVRRMTKAGEPRSPPG